MKRTIHTSDEFIYDVLNNMIHHNELIIPTKDLENSRSLNNIVNRFKDFFERDTKSLPHHVILRKVRNIDANIRYRKPRT